MKSPLDNLYPQILCSIISVLFVLFSCGSLKAQLSNGDFETGNFTGWSFFTTPNGTLGNPVVQQFDTSGSGSSDAAQFEVGETTFASVSAGGGITQTVSLAAGELNLSLNIASYASGSSNADGGTFELLLDGNVVSSHAFGNINSQEIERATLSYVGVTTAGSHTIGIEMGRSFLNETGGGTPYQYIDNVQLSQTPISTPEPSTWAMLLSGLGLLAFRYRRKVNA
jgi:PEP-CTERM motif